MNEDILLSQYFDEKIVDMDNSIFQLQIKLGGLAYDLIHLFSSELSISIKFPFIKNSEYEIIQTEKIIYNEEIEKIEIFIKGQKNPIFWDNLDLNSMEIMINELYLIFRNHHELKKLKSGEISH